MPGPPLFLKRRAELFSCEGMESDQPSTSSVQWSQLCRHFEYPEILAATENFDESLVIGKGGFGKVYKGHIIMGASYVVAAIKRLDTMSNQGATEFWSEVELLSKFRHCNLVSLFGYCSYEKEMILVYEYMPNGTLDDHLHKLGTPLSWVQRLNICIGAGRGLDYLHTGTGIQSGVVHRDIKSSNILLHESWAAKISDFGLSKLIPTNQPSTSVNTLVKGTFGYMDPGYFSTGRLTKKFDVYAFGVVLLEVLCRKRAVDTSLDDEQWGLVTWAQDSIKEGNLKRIIDSDIRDEISSKCLRQFVRIVEICLHDSPKQRPTMTEVVSCLQSILALQEKFNNSLQSAGRTIIDRIMLHFTSNRENSAISVKDRVDNNMFPEMKEVPADSQSPNPSAKEFKFDDLKKATGNFSPDLLLGTGGFGNVFLGWIDRNTLAPSKHGDGIAVAVKRFNLKSCQVAEMNLLRRLDHPNIIRLLGCCSHKQEHLIVYEYMLNKSIYDFLFIADGPDVAEPLSWETRLLIMIGVARGLMYLHSIKLIHGDLKSSKILLDEDFNAKLGGFELAKHGLETYVPTVIKSFIGYLDPEYIRTGHLSTKSNIYSFGVVLLENVTCQRAFDYNRPEGQQSLVEWATQIQSDRRNVNEIMDRRLEHNHPLQGASECFALALRCVERRPKDRPSSEEVLQILKQIYALHK